MTEPGKESLLTGAPALAGSNAQRQLRPFSAAVDPHLTLSEIPCCVLVRLQSVPVTEKETERERK